MDKVKRFDWVVKKAGIIPTIWLALLSILWEPKVASADAGVAWLMMEMWNQAQKNLYISNIENNIKRWGILNNSDIPDASKVEHEFSSLLLSLTYSRSALPLLYWWIQIWARYNLSNDQMMNLFVIYHKKEALLSDIDSTFSGVKRFYNGNLYIKLDQVRSIYNHNFLSYSHIREVFKDYFEYENELERNNYLFPLLMWGGTISFTVLFLVWFAYIVKRDEKKNLRVNK